VSSDVATGAADFACAASSGDGVDSRYPRQVGSDTAASLDASPTVVEGGAALAEVEDGATGGDRDALRARASRRPTLPALAGDEVMDAPAVELLRGLEQAGLRQGARPFDSSARGGVSDPPDLMLPSGRSQPRPEVAMPADSGWVGMNAHRDGSGQLVEGLGHRGQQHPVAGRRYEFGTVELAAVTSVLKDSSPSAWTTIAVAHTGREYVDCPLPLYLPVRHPRHPGWDRS
jgi:hypothetical protein